MMKLFGGNYQPHLLFFEQLEAYINRKVLRTGVLATTGSSPDESDFFPNLASLGFQRQASVSPKLRRSVDEEDELQTFYGLRFPAALNSMFNLAQWPTGRRRVLGELSAWLSNTEDTRNRLITDRPGSGSPCPRKIVPCRSRIQAQGSAARPRGHWLIQEAGIDLARSCEGQDAAGYDTQACR